MKRLAIALTLLPTLAAAQPQQPLPPTVALPTDIVQQASRCLHLGCTREEADQLYFRMGDAAMQDVARQRAEAAKVPAPAPAAPAEQAKP